MTVRALDLLKQHVSARRTGIVRITSPASTAEISLVDGHIIHATCGKADGEKALVRALALRDATADMIEREPPDARTIKTATTELLATATAAVDDVLALRGQFLIDAPLVAVDPGPPTVNLQSRPRPTEELSVAARSLLHFLRSPITFEALLDADPGSDHEILNALAELERGGRLRALASPKTKVPVASPSDLVRIERALETRNKLTFGLRARLIVAGAPHHLALVGHAVTCFEGATAPPEAPPSVPMPHVAVRWTAERADVDIVLCPLVPAYSPLWPMTLAGAHAALRLDGAARELFDRACATAGVKTVDAGSLLPTHDETRVEDVATLVRGALLD